jgi:hypothetical protein
LTATRVYYSDNAVGEKERERENVRDKEKSIQKRSVN